MLQSVAECNRVLQSVAECGRVLQSVAECCTDTIQNTLDNIWNQLKVISTKEDKIDRAGNSDE